ncbi:MAG: hypothetical protein JWM80_6148 [Cyanobacteria bacterium RYN_339]|nr:hypothetical protein [Cyanobacteria bacterium RYN_339]
MNVQNAGTRLPISRAANTPAPAPVDLEGLSASAYGALARSFREKGQADLADRYTLEAAKAAADGTEALKYAAQRYGPKADASAPMNEYIRSDAPYVASPEIQVKAAGLAATKLTDFDKAVWALRDNPCQSKDANTLVIKRIVDLAKDSDLLRKVMPLVKALGSPEGIAYAQAAIKSKPKPSFWTLLFRGLQQL